MTRTVLTLGCAAVLCLAYPEVRAAAQGAPPTPPEAKPAAPEAKPTTEGEGTKPEGSPRAQPGSAARNA